MNKKQRRRSTNPQIGFDRLEPRNVLASFLPVAVNVHLPSETIYIVADPASELTRVAVEDFGSNEVTIVEFDGDNNRTLTDYDVTGINTLRYVGSDGVDDFRIELAFSAELKSVIRGNGGNDRLSSGSFTSRIYGGEGDDTIFAGGSGEFQSTGQQFAFGEAGDDTIYAGYQVIDSDLRNYADGGDGDDNIFGGSGADILVGGTGNDRIDGFDFQTYHFPLGVDNDLIYGGDGDDFIEGKHGADRILGGAGNDTIHGSSLQPIDGVDDGGDRILGQDGDDELFGGNDADKILGGNGNDRLLAYAGDDFLSGGDGNDFFAGHNGNDSILGR